jgi:hypothetical protein
MMEAVHTSETSVDNYFTRQYIPEDNSEHHTHRRENLKSHTISEQPTCVETFVIFNLAHTHNLKSYAYSRHSTADRNVSTFLIKVENSISVRMLLSITNEQRLPITVAVYTHTHDVSRWKV